jgi:hypothetical protein
LIKERKEKARPTELGRLKQEEGGRGEAVVAARGRLIYKGSTTDTVMDPLEQLY